MSYGHGLGVVLVLAAAAVFAGGGHKEGPDIFGGALDSANRARWEVPDGVTAEWSCAGVVFRASAEGSREVRYEVAVPAELRGRPVRQEADVRSLAALVWHGSVHVEQIDGRGQALPEPVCDKRSANHMRPPGKATRYRIPGRIHPKASRLRLVVELNSVSTAYDAHGYPLRNAADRLPVLELTHFALVPVAEERIPGLRTFVFGGPDERSFFYQCNSRAVWSQGVQIGDADDRFFPAGDGTLEGWFKPNLKAVSAGGKPLAVAIFSGDNGFTTVGQTPGKGEVFALYRVGTGFRVKLTDWAGHGFSGEAKDVPFPDGEWTHLALTWSCGGTARLWVNGVERLTLPIPGFEANPLKDPARSNKNDLGVTELFVGGNARIVRKNWGANSGARLFEGEGDDIRVSSGVRYTAAFKPSRGYALDGATRALFTFDGTYDGVSAGGLGFIPASVQSKAERDGRVTGPLKDADDPRKVFDLDNYPVMPSAADYREARVRRTAGFDVRPGAVLEVGCAPRSAMEWVEIANTGKEDLLHPIVVRDGALDPRSFGDIADSVRAMGLDDRARVDRVFQYVISASDYFMNWQLTFDPGSDAPRRAWWDALVNLNAYCGFECGPLNNLAANLFATAADCPAAETQGYEHTFEQVFYGGKNRLYDLSAQMFIPKMDNSGPASLEEVEDQPGAFARVGKASDHFIRKTTRRSSPRDVAYAAKAALVLRPGERFRVHAANDGRFNNLCSFPRRGSFASKGVGFDECDYAEMSGAKTASVIVKRIDRPFPHFSTGVIAYDGAPAKEVLEPAADGSLVYRVASVYPVVWGEYAAYLKDGSTAPLELSTDLKSFAALPKGTDGVTRLEYRVRARHEYLVRVKAAPGAVRRFVARTEVVVNPRTYPGWLKDGANRLTFKAGPEGSARVTFSWREPAKEIVVKGGAYQGTIPGCERQLVLVDPDRPLDLAVEGAGAAAKARAFGPLAAKLAGGRLTLAADASKGPLKAHGDDLGYAGPVFPAFAAVEIADGEAVKKLTVLIARNARLAVPEGATAGEVQPCVRLTAKDAPATVRFDALPAGSYSVFALTRWASHPRCGRAELMLKDPADPAKRHAVAAWRNGCFDFLKAHYGRAGGRANWRWDTVPWGAEKGQKPYCGWSIRTFDLPEATDRLDFILRYGNPEATEFAAVLVLPDADREFRADLRAMLFGLNADPTIRMED